MNMNNPELFSKNNSVTRAGVIQCLKEYATKIKWNKNGDSIIDLGCGDGSATCILKKYLPNNYKQFVACDINEKMLDFAKEHHGDENITFRKQDLASDLADDLKYKFDHVFSFYLIHWIRNQEKAFINVYDLLTKGGDCLIAFVGYHPVFHVYDIIDQRGKWKSTWIKDVNIFLSPYYHVQDPNEKITHMLENIGFCNVDVQCKKTKYVFESLGKLKKFVESVQPFGMPPNVYDEFFRDFVAVGKEIGFINNSIGNENEPNSIQCDYCLIVVHATKPFN